MSEIQGTVFIVDDDASMRRTVECLCQSRGLRTRGFSSVADFLQQGANACPACVLLDVRMPWLSGLDLQRELAVRQIDTPVIFIAGHGDVPTSVRAMKVE